MKDQTSKALLDKLRPYFIAVWGIELRIAPWDGWLVTFTRGKEWPTGTVRLPLHADQFKSEPAMAAWIATVRCALTIVDDLGGAAESWA